MGIIRRLLGRGQPEATPDAHEADDAGATVTGDAGDEQARERELLLDDARRLDNELIQRQLRYADRAWNPPAQGGPRRADDEEPGGEER